jgi:hypothetical protein
VFEQWGAVEPVPEGEPAEVDRRIEADWHVPTGGWARDT